MLRTQQNWNIPHGRWLLAALLVTSATALSAAHARAKPRAKPSATPSVKPTSSAKKSASKRWDITKKRWPTRDVTIDVTEGTWMSVTVHPDGSKVVFDLLGDLYELPIGGGEAKQLTSGIAWDMQPVFSPNGRYLAFTSDRGGADNIWVMPSGGGKARAVTKEKFRLLNSPNWSADSRFVVARKHFTGRRSLGAGEIWLYHVSGGQGVQMTKRPNQQKDVGEPALSPDGRFLYYSRDATPGKTFKYNKDPNKSIFKIFRLNRLTGKTERFIGGPGGAIRPTPSPDGKWLSYIRRIRGKSVLIARNLKSGEEKRLYDELDRDLQETWSIHGVYAALAWTPDSRSMVVWAKGKLWRIGLHGQVKPLPFHVKTKRTLHRALRRPVKVGAPTFKIRAVRWPQVSPNGKRVVFEALGRLWIRDLAGGQAKRLTRQQQDQELTPSWSRDGKRITYASWNDEGLGAIRVISAKGGKVGRVITPEPGHYRSPVFDPQGRAVVFEKLSGGWLRSALWSANPGIYTVSAKGGAMVRIAQKGDSPHFANAPDRVFFHRHQAAKKQHQLVSVGLGDHVERVHVVSKFASEMRLSPLGDWLAFREGFEVWATPFAFAGRPVSVGPKGKGLPIRRASRNGGSYLSWSGERLSWSTGPVLSVVGIASLQRTGNAKLRANNKSRLAKVRAKLGAKGSKSGKSKSGGKAAIKAQKTDLSFSAATDKGSGTVALVDVRIVTMAGHGKDGGLIADGVIVWTGDRIVAIGPKGAVTIPPGAKRISGGGKTAVPGFIDVHAHGAQGRHGIIPQRNWASHSLLSFGVTTIHDPSNHTETVFAASEQQKAGKILAPRLFSTGSILYGATARWTVKINSKADALRHLKRLKAIGAFSVKSYNQPRREQRQQILAAARELNMMVVPEGGALFMHNMTQVVDGHTGVEHALPIARVYADVVQLWSQSQVGHTPTLGVAYGGLGGENYWYAKTRVDQHERLGRFVPPWAIDPRARRPTKAPAGSWNHIAAARFAKQLIDAGGRVQLGAHGQREGLAVHWELWSFVQGGMTPVEALRAGTLAGAQYLGLDGDIGSLQKGKLADITLIDGKPDQDIRASERVSLVVLGGRVFEAATMRPIWPAGPKPKPWFWQRTGHPSHGPTNAHTHTCGCGKN
ncbi:MAG: PD40 domain-containing protein [Myxococcales bacterium]|nr:PD40 domain-containing protein [Myxococcales bacterium]